MTAYTSILKIIKLYFTEMALQDITAIDIEKYLSYLRTEYKGHDYAHDLHPPNSGCKYRYLVFCERATE